MLNVEGCEEAKADWEKGLAWAKYDPAKTTPEELAKAINDNTSFKASVAKKEEKKRQYLEASPGTFPPVEEKFAQLTALEV